MIRILPFVLIPILLIAGLGYWRFVATKQDSTPTSTTQTEESTANEVPKTLPNASLEDRVQVLEVTLNKIAPQINNLKSASPVQSSSLDTRVTALETSMTDLKVRVAALEKASPSPAAASSVSKSPLYIPMGSGGGPWNDQNWNTLNEYQVSINPDNYSSYSSMQMEVNFRMVEAAGTASVRLYNVTDSSAVSAQVDTTATSFSLHTSGTFKLPSGQKTYTIQVKSSQNMAVFIQAARIKVNF